MVAGLGGVAGSVGGVEGVEGALGGVEDPAGGARHLVAAAGALEGGDGVVDGVVGALFGGGQLGESSGGGQQDGRSDGPRRRVSATCSASSVSLLSGLQRVDGVGEGASEQAQVLATARGVGLRGPQRSRRPQAPLRFLDPPPARDVGDVVGEQPELPGAVTDHCLA